MHLIINDKVYMIKLLEKDDPKLRLIAEPIVETEFGSEELKKLVEDLFVIMDENAAVGVAAPQIGISKRVIVFGTMSTNTRKPTNPIQNTALINPEYKILSDEIQIDYEGCLNCDFLMGLVPRAMEIEYSGFDPDGNPITKIATGLEARILQHEIDHLDGYLFLDRMENDSTLTTLSELQEKS